MDKVMAHWLEGQLEAGMALHAKSDLLELRPVELGLFPPRQYIVDLHVKGLVRERDGRIVEAQGFSFGVSFAEDHLLTVNPWNLLRWFGPRHVWSPNISDVAPVLCIGEVAPGTKLVELLYRVTDLVTWKNFGTREDDCLNKAAAAWARQNLARFPIDSRPLKWRAQPTAALAAPEE